MNSALLLCCLSHLLPPFITPQEGRATGAFAVPCHDQWPSWAPAGDRVVFSSTRTGDTEIYVLTLANGECQQLTETPGRDAHPCFSPAGDRIAFQSPRAEKCVS